MAKNEAELWRKAVLFWPASIEVGCLSGGCFKPKECMDCGLPTEKGKHVCQGCQKIIDKGGTP